MFKLHSFKLSHLNIFFYFNALWLLASKILTKNKKLKTTNRTK